ncbi:hypothetical protein FQR65_LT02167 [Abscondita terminalis]|nr:hypothetical protein FQR65_LT02167 [Abscondita terminalis]
MKKFLTVWLTMYLQLWCVRAFTRTNFFIQKLEDCDPRNRSKVSFNLYTRNNEQYCDFDAIVEVPLDERVGARFTIDTTVNGQQYIPLTNIYDKNFCVVCKKYGGEFFYDFQRAMQVNPGTCPMTKRHYRVRNYKMDFSKISLQTFPFGKLRMTVNVIENANQNVVFCFRANVENKIN